LAAVDAAGNVRVDDPDRSVLVAANGVNVLVAIVAEKYRECLAQRLVGRHVPVVRVVAH